MKLSDPSKGLPPNEKEAPSPSQATDKNILDTVILSREEAIEILNKGVDVANFGDPVEWQKEVRKDNEIGSLNKLI